MKILILVLFCAFSTLLLSCSDVNSGNGTNSNGNDDGNNNGNNGSSKTVTAANLNEFFDVLFQDRVLGALEQPCPVISSTGNQSVQRCQGIVSGHRLHTNNSSNRTNRAEFFNFSNRGMVYQDGTVNATWTEAGDWHEGTLTLIATTNGHAKITGEFNATITYENVRSTIWLNQGPSVFLGGRIMIGSLDVTNTYFRRFMEIPVNMQ